VVFGEKAIRETTFGEKLLGKWLSGKRSVVEMAFGEKVFGDVVGHEGIFANRRITDTSKP